jgi:hypothetical protein
VAQNRAGCCGACQRPKSSHYALYALKFDLDVRLIAQTYFSFNLGYNANKKEIG